jgi:hypothetical protein
MIKYKKERLMRMLITVVLQRTPETDWNEVIPRIIEVDDNDIALRSAIKVAAEDIAIDAKQRSKVMSVSVCILPS